MVMTVGLSLEILPIDCLNMKLWSNSYTDNLMINDANISMNCQAMS